MDSLLRADLLPVSHQLVVILQIMIVARDKMLYVVDADTVTVVTHAECPDDLIGIFQIHCEVLYWSYFGLISKIPLLVWVNHFLKIYQDNH